MTAKETIDIEALLYRAYAQYRIDRLVGRGGEHALKAMLGMPASPVMSSPSWQPRVDTSAPGSRLAALASAASAAPDPLTILHDRVLALGDLWFAYAGDDVALWDSAAAAAAGCRIGQVGGEWWLLRGHVMVERLEQAGVMALVIQHGRQGTRPEVHAGWRRGRGVRSADGQAHDHRGRRRARGAALAQREVQYDRALYHAWRCALVLLQAECEGMMPGYEVSGPVAPAAPWLPCAIAQPETASAAINRSADCLEGSMA